MTRRLVTLTDAEDPPPTMLAYEHNGKARWYRLCGSSSGSAEREAMERSGERIVDVVPEGWLS